MREEFEKLPKVAEVIKKYDGYRIGNKYSTYDAAYTAWLNGAWYAWQAKAQAVPEGFVLVPREPTDAMRNLFNESLVVIYRAMIEVAEKEMIAAQEQNQ